jgi:hypothetical protein
MANAVVTDNEAMTPFNQAHVVFSRFNYANSGDTVLVPRGAVAAAMLEVGTWTVTITAGADNDSIAISGGAFGVGLTLVTRHGGNSAAVR